MDGESAPTGVVATPAEGTSGRRHATVFIAAAVVGALGLIAYAYGAARWGSVDDLGLLLLVFALLLVGYSTIAVFGVRAGVVAPFVVAALLLPWASTGAAALGAGQRVEGALEELTGDSSMTLEEETGSGQALEEPTTGDAAAGELAAGDEVEGFVTPPDDVTGAVPLGEPVPFTQLMGPGEGEVAEWVITVESLECGVTNLPDAEYSAAGGMVDAVPRTGFEFCLITTEWANVGDVESWAMPLGHIVVAGEQIAHENRDIARGFGVMEQRGFPDVGDVVTPGGVAQQVDVYEVPAGASPDHVWITRDDPKALAATA